MNLNKNEAKKILNGPLKKTEFKFITDQWVPRMGRNFDDYPGFQIKITHAN